METMLLRSLGRFIAKGNLAIVTPDGMSHHLGDGSGPPVTLLIRSQHAIIRLLRDPSLGFAEGFMEGEIALGEGDLLDLLHIVFLNGNYERATGAFSFLRSGARLLLRRLQQINTLRRSRANVHHHYDLSNAMYRLFLDPDMQYSCAYFEHPGQSLEDAQLAKKRHIAAKLAVEPSQSVLDIGSGWGGLACALSDAGAAEVLGVTLSEEQLAYARRRLAPAQEGRVRFDLADYRSLAGRFDRIVSVGMFEHVGVGSYPTFFRTCRRLLADDGAMLLHTIGCSAEPGFTTPWLDKYIFPGGYIPSLSEILPEIERAGLIVTDIEVMRHHYAWTLKAWRERFMANRGKAAAIYDERFCRMWEYYLAAAQAAFEYEDLVVFQIQIARRADAVPVTRTYMEA